MLQLHPESSTAPAASIGPSERPTQSATKSVPAKTAAAAIGATKPVGLRSDRFALLFWLVCVGIMSVLLLKDFAVALLFR
jgi:hypothetical protein